MNFLNVGGSAEFYCAAESFELLSYQWYKDDEKLIGNINYKDYTYRKVSKQVNIVVLLKI